MGREELEALVRAALEEAKARGVDQAEVAASSDTGLAATARLGDVENLEYTNDRGLWITVYKESRKGSASTSDTCAESIREAVEKACTFADCTAQDKYAGLADAELMCTEPRDLDLDHPWAIAADDAIDTRELVGADDEVEAGNQSVLVRLVVAHLQFRRRDRRNQPGCARLRQHARFCWQLREVQP